MASSNRHRLLLSVALPFTAIAIAGACGGKEEESPARELASALETTSLDTPLESKKFEDGAWKLISTEDGVIPYGHQAIALDDGKLLLTGGQGGDERSTSAVLLFDPKTQEFTSLADMHEGRHEHHVVKLANGSILVLGGEVHTESDYFSSSSTELFDPVARSWTRMADIPALQQWPSVTALPDGKVLMAGGQQDWSLTKSVQIFDTADGPGGVWSDAEPLPVRLTDHTASLLSDGSVYIAGGHASQDGGELGLSADSETCYRYKDGNWEISNRFDLIAPRVQHTATVLQDGRVLIAGGMSSATEGEVGVVEIHDPLGGTAPVEVPGGMLTPRTRHGAALLPDGRVILVGGSSSYTDLASTEIYDPATNSFSFGPSLAMPDSETRVFALRAHLVALSNTWNPQLQIIQLGAEIGDACSADSECVSNYCVDGVCCESACEGACFACSAALKGGGDDGFCGAAAAGSNPREMCSDEGAASCGTSGLCDGDGACALYEDGTVCGEGLVCAAGVCEAGSVEFCAEQPNGTHCGDDEACTISLCQNSACIKTHKLDGTLCEGGICMAGECKADKAAPFTGDSTGVGGDDGLAGVEPSDSGPADQLGSGSPEDGADEGGGLCSTAPGTRGSLPMAFALALLAGMGISRRQSRSVR